MEKLISGAIKEAKAQNKTQVLVDLQKYCRDFASRNARCKRTFDYFARQGYYLNWVFDGNGWVNDVFVVQLTWSKP